MCVSVVARVRAWRLAAGAKRRRRPGPGAETRHRRSRDDVLGDSAAAQVRYRQRRAVPSGWEATRRARQADRRRRWVMLLGACSCAALQRQPDGELVPSLKIRGGGSGRLTVLTVPRARGRQRASERAREQEREMKKVEASPVEAVTGAVSALNEGAAAEKQNYGGKEREEHCPAHWT